MTDANMQAEMAEMRLRFEEAEETIRAIRSGAVDAFVVEVPHGAQVYTLQTADRPYRLLVEEMQQGAITLSDDGTITYCNRRFADLVGRPLQRLVGVAFRDFIPLDAQCFYESLLQQGRADFSQGESHVQNADGALVPVFLTLNALPPDCGAAIGLLVTDLTTQRHQEKRNALLEALTEADRRKNEFLAMLSHELRNPLAAISNAAQLLRLQKSEDPLQEQAQAIIERQLGQLTHLVDELLEIARITTGRIHLNEQHVTLAGIVENAVETVSVLIGRHRHAFEVSLPPEPILLYADAARLEQVVVNLLTNAAKYTDAGGQIWLSVEQEVDEAVIRVRDTGVGIAPDMLPRIFELFTQAERSLDRAQGGLGIGLCLVQRLVQMHRGRVEAYSVLGQGSEFVVRLPLAQTPTLPPLSAITEAIKPTGPFWRVLVVDDNRDAAQTAAMLLMAWGHEVRTAYDGPAALEAAHDFQPSVVLLDIGLPGLDGLEVARGLRQQSAFSHAVLIAMTGYGQETDRQRSLAAGFDHHLVKPLDFEKVRHILSNILQKAT